MLVTTAAGGVSEEVEPRREEGEWSGGRKSREEGLMSSVSSTGAARFLDRVCRRGMLKTVREFAERDKRTRKKKRTDPPSGFP